MPKYLKKIPHVLVILPTIHKAWRDKLRGILKYARIHGPWDVQTLEKHPYIARLDGFKTWKPDGILDGSDSDKIASIKHVARIPIVTLDPLSPLLKRHSSVQHDSQQIAATVVNHFLQAGLKHFGFIGCLPSPAWSRARLLAFSEHLKQAGFHSQIYEPENAQDWGLEQIHMGQWLLALPKPCGIMVAVDLRAKQVLDTCIAEGIRVPEEIAVVSVDNDETICENTTPSLSSVLPDFEGCGYLAAELLDNLMRGTQKKPAHLTYGIKEIIQRQSSQFIPHSNRLIISAVEFIRLNACAGITVMDVVQNMKVSRRFAERHFRDTRNHSILDEIQHFRLARVCSLLRETNLPIQEIGERCGYDTEIYLKVLFKKRFGMTMREFRKR